MTAVAQQIRELDELAERYANAEMLAFASAYDQASFNAWYWLPNGQIREEVARDALSAAALNAKLAADGIDWRLPAVRAQLPEWLQTHMH